MSLWPDTEFQRVGKSTKLSARTLAACRDVLVEGMPGVDVAAQHAIKPAQISRALGVLRDRRDEISKSAELLKSETEVLKTTAAQVAKNIAGDGLVIVDAQAGQVYEGKMIVNTHGFMVQQIGRTGIMHDLGNLEKMPTLNTLLTIAYPASGGKALVREDLGSEQARGLGR